MSCEEIIMGVDLPTTYNLSDDVIKGLLQNLVNFVICTDDGHGKYNGEQLDAVRKDAVNFLALVKTKPDFAKHLPQSV